MNIAKSIPALKLKPSQIIHDYFFITLGPLPVWVR